MKINLNKQKKVTLALICCVAVFFSGVLLISHLYYHRSVMATFSEWAMLIVDRDSIYSQGEDFVKNLRLKGETNLQDQAIPDGVAMDKIGRAHV